MRTKLFLIVIAIGYVFTLIVDLLQGVKIFVGQPSTLDSINYFFNQIRVFLNNTIYDAYNWLLIVSVILILKFSNDRKLKESQGT